MNVPDPIQEAADNGALFVVNVSGGKDGQAAGIILQDLVPARQQLWLHADLAEVEWRGAREAAELQAAAAGAPFQAVKAGKTFIEMVERRFRERPEVPSWPSPKFRQCTSDLKRQPLQKAAREYALAHGFTTIVNVMGLRAEESSKRAKLPPCMVNQGLCTKDRTFKNGRSVTGRTWLEWLPIHDLKQEEVFGTIQAAGQQPHEAYALGNDRMSCVFCIMATASDLQNGARHNPELYQRLARLEQRTGYAMHASMKTLPELTGVALED